MPPKKLNRSRTPAGRGGLKASSKKYNSSKKRSASSDINSENDSLNAAGRRKSSNNKRTGSRRQSASPKESGNNTGVIGNNNDPSKRRSFLSKIAAQILQDPGALTTQASELSQQRTKPIAEVSGLYKERLIRGKADNSNIEDQNNHDLRESISNVSTPMNRLRSSKKKVSKSLSRSVGNSGLRQRRGSSVTSNSINNDIKNSMKTTTSKTSFFGQTNQDTKTQNSQSEDDNDDDFDESLDSESDDDDDDDEDFSKYTIHSPPGEPGHFSMKSSKQRAQSMIPNFGSSEWQSPTVDDATLASIQKNNDGTMFRRNVEFVEKPRSVIMALLIIVYLIWASFFSELGFKQNATNSELIRNALTVMFVANCVYAVLNLRDSQYTLRPHPAFWRLIHGCCLFYFYILIMMTALPPEKGKWFVQEVFPSKNTAARPKPTGQVDVAAAIQAKKDNQVTATSTVNSAIGGAVNIYSNSASIDNKGQSFVEDSNDTLGDWHLNCAITGETVWNQLTSLWFIAHVAGWQGYDILNFIQIPNKFSIIKVGENVYST